MSMYAPTQYNDAEDFQPTDFSREHGWWILSDHSRRRYENTYPKSDNWEQCWRPSCKRNYYPTSTDTHWYCDKCCHDLIIQRSKRCGKMIQEQAKEEQA